MNTQSNPSHEGTKLRQRLLVNEDWSYCEGGGRCQDTGAIYDANLDRHIMSPEDVDALVALIEQEIANTLHDIVAENTDTMAGTTDADGIFDSIIRRFADYRTKQERPRKEDINHA